MPKKIGTIYSVMQVGISSLVLDRKEIELFLPSEKIKIDVLDVFQFIKNKVLLIGTRRIRMQDSKNGSTLSDSDIETIVKSVARMFFLLKNPIYSCVIPEPQILITKILEPINVRETVEIDISIVPAKTEEDGLGLLRFKNPEYKFRIKRKHNKNFRTTAVKGKLTLNI